MVSQVAVTDMSGTTQLDLSAQGAREREKKVKPSRNTSQTGSFAEDRLF